MDDITKAALEIVKAQAATRIMTDEEITSMIKSVAAGIRAIDSGDALAEDVPAPSFGDPKKAVREKSVLCLECGKTFKIITKKHLELHGLTPASYREKYGIKKGAPLAAKELVRARRAKMKDMELWKRRKGAATSEAVQ